MKAYGFAYKEWNEWKADYSRKFGEFDGLIRFLLTREAGFLGELIEGSEAHPRAKKSRRLLAFIDLNSAKGARNILREKWEVTCGEIEEIDWKDETITKTN